MLADWDPRLITPERALRLAGDWPIRATYELARLSQFEPEAGGQRQADRWQVSLRCATDSQSCGLLGDPAGTVTTIGDLLSAVLRHLVTAHDLPLSGARDG